MGAQAPRRSGDHARRHAPRWCRSPPTTSTENKGLTDLWLIPVAGGAGAPAHQRQGQRHAAHRESRRQVDRVRLQARRRHGKPDLRDRGRRRRSAARDQPADRRLRAEVVSGQHAARVRERGVAGPRALGRPGGAQEGARRLEDDGARLDEGADLLLRPLPRRSRAAPVLDRARRRRADGDHAHVGLSPLEAGIRRTSLRHLARRPRSRVRRRRRQDRHRQQLRHHSARGLRLQTAARHHARPARPTTTRRATARMAAASHSRRSASRGSTPTARA